MVDKNGTTFVFIMVLPKNMHYFSEGKMDINFLFEKSFLFDFFLIAPIENNSLLNESFFLVGLQACNFKTLRSFVTTHIIIRISGLSATSFFQ
jgi:hypothetical protein